MWAVRTSLLDATPSSASSTASELIPLHEASLADSHEQARKLAEAFQTAS
ncbi:hypothetical protein [Streptomyces sp. NPDC001536]